MKFLRPEMSIFVERVMTWASADPVVRSILVVGSLVRDDHPADEWSDLDMVIYTTDLDRFNTNLDWLDSIGEVWVWVRYGQGENPPEYLALFDGGIKLDFAFEPLTRLQSLIEEQRLPGYMRRGYEILLDKDGLAAKLPPPYILPAERPSQAVFEETVRRFWYDVSQVAKRIRRRDLWVVKAQDSALKEHLLHLIEWHAQVVHNHDTWHEGRFMAEWADPEIWKTLPDTFGGFDAASSWRALLATMDLFRRLALEIAPLLQYPYPTRLDDQITRWIQQMHAEDDF
jgi:aminoglycoside 6-adenylyltransferase